MHTGVSQRKYRLRRILVSFVGLTLALGAAASETLQSTMRFERIGIEDGLSQSAVMDVVQDASGFLWFATESGVDRYDGFQFQHYRHERGNPASLADNFVRDLEVGGDGSVWAATDGGGVSRWDPESDSFKTWHHDSDNENSLSSDRTRRILIDSNGDLWVATRESGLDYLQLKTGQITHYRHDPADESSINSDEVYALAMAEDGTIWVGTRAGLNRINPADKSVSRFTHDSVEFGAVASAHIRSLLVNRAGDLWIGTNDDGLHLHVAGRQTAVAYRHATSSDESLSSNRIETIFEDASGRLWVGTDVGLNLFNNDERRFYRYTSKPNDVTSLSDSFVFSIFQDRGGILWVGTRSGGANKWNPKSWLFGHFRIRDESGSLSTNSHVTSFTMDRLGRSWVGTFGGGIKIIAADQSAVSTLRNDPEDPESLSDNRVMSLLMTKDGSVWAGTMRGGLNRIDPQTLAVTHYIHDPSDPHSLAANGIMSLYEDRSGRLWVGTFGGGVSRFRTESNDFENFANSDDSTSISSNRATSIIEDASGGIWVGTDGGGLNRTTDDGKSWKKFVHSKELGGLSANTIYSLHEGANREVWIGTRSGLDKATFSGAQHDSISIENVNADNEFSNRSIYSLVSDSADRLWAATERGLLSINQATDAVRAYHSEQGLQGDEFNFGAGYYAATGELFFGGPNGFNRFDPRELNYVLPAASINLISFEIWNKEVEIETPYEKLDEINLGFRDDSVSFEFAAMDFESPERHQYSHQLEGFDEAWVDTGTNRRVDYTNLSAGTYTLRVRVAQGDQRWSPNELQIPITVAQAPWETWWAYLIYTVSLLGLFYAIYSYQDRKLRREAQISQRLESEVEARTIELNEKNRDLQQINEKLATLSTTDSLTGLRNRRYLFEKVSKDADLVVRRQKNILRKSHNADNSDLLFLVVDLDGFKSINDTFGHQAGDELLIQIRDVLFESCRTSDDIIRWGGDEFLIVARDANPAYAANLAERIRSNLAQRAFVVADGHVARTTASIGYCGFPFIKSQPDLLSWDDALGIADTAMYEAKKAKNSWIGIEGLRWTEDSDSLFAGIKTDANELATRGCIRWVTSIEEAEAEIA